MEQNELMEVEDKKGYIADLTRPAEMVYCDFTPATTKEKKQLYNAINNPSARLREMVNIPLKITHVYVEVVACVNKDSGEISNCPRIVLIDEKGDGYVCVSIGVFNALKKMFTVFGRPDTWAEPMTIIPKTVAKGELNILTFDIK